MGEITHAAMWQKLGGSPDASPPRRLVSCECRADASEEQAMTGSRIDSQRQEQK
jgi:hypothetical protein